MMGSVGLPRKLPVKPQVKESNSYVFLLSVFSCSLTVYLLDFYVTSLQLFWLHLLKLCPEFQI